MAQHEGLDLPDWNEGLKRFGETPEKDKKQRLHSVVGSAARVYANHHRHHTENQRSLLPGHNSSILRAEGLRNLPNILDAEHWIRKALQEETDGRIDAAVLLLNEALDRDVQPASALIYALHQMQKQYNLPRDCTYLDTSTRCSTPTRSGVRGHALRLPAHFAKTPHTKEALQAAVNPPPTTAFKGILKTLTASVLPGTTTKQLRFELDGTTPAQRRVTFDSSTVSPIAAKPHRLSHVHYSPGPTILEDDEKTILAEYPSSVNSANAGSTPYDKRLSSLFRKYKLSISPTVITHQEAEYDVLDEMALEALRPDSPAWKRLSSGSIPESIKALSNKYACAAASENESPPTTVATPHDELKSVLTKNRAYESESEEKRRATTPRTLIARIFGPLVGAAAQEMKGGQYKASSMTPIRQFNPPSFGGYASIPEDEELTPMSADGIPRTVDGVPAFTPASVTVYRGASCLPSKADSLAMTLFEFDAPRMPSSTVQLEEQEFSFCKAVGEERTPDLKGAIARDTSPEILGFTESQTKSDAPPPTVDAHRRKSTTPVLPHAAFPVTCDGTPTIGKAMRVPSMSPIAGRSDLTSMLEDLQLDSTASELTLKDVVEVGSTPHRYRTRSATRASSATPSLAGETPQMASNSSPCPLDSLENCYMTPVVPASTGNNRAPPPTILVPQDTSPDLSPKTFGSPTNTLSFPDNSKGRYGLRSQTKKPTKSPSDDTLKLSPTEQNIRNSLRKKKKSPF